MQYEKTQLKSSLRYREFGKFAINMKLLYDNILLCKYKNSYAPVPKLKRTPVSQDFVDELLYVFDTNKIDYEKLRELSNKENELFKTLIMKAGVFDILHYDESKTREKIDDILEQYDILKGEIEADNNNPEIITKIKSILKKLCNYGKLSTSNYLELMKDF
jgi:hypothetical protein